MVTAVNGTLFLDISNFGTLEVFKIYPKSRDSVNLLFFHGLTACFATSTSQENSKI